MHKYKKIAILADGTYPRAQYPLEILAQADIVICCDASVEKLKGREPNFIVGDMDTLSPTLQEKYSDKIENREQRLPQKRQMQRGKIHAKQRLVFFVLPPNGKFSP